MPMMCGGCGDVKEADEKIQQLCDGVSRKTLLSLVASEPNCAHLANGRPVLVLFSSFLVFTQVKAAAEAKAGKKYETFTAKCYTKQLVAGTNYFIKVMQGQL